MSKHRKEFLSGDAWTCPAGVYRVTLTGCGGGGGGGAGREAPNQANLWLGGGSGGGGAVLNTVDVAVTPGTIYEIEIGAGGTASNADSDGFDGEDTLFYESGVGPDPLLAQFYGAGGGKRGGGVTGNTLYYFIKGGLPVRMTGEDNYINYQLLVNTSSVNFLVYPQTLQQQGGWTVTGTNSAEASMGGPSPVAYETDARGGAGGARGTDSGTYRAGTGGGGGGMGAFGKAGEGNDGGYGGTANAIGGNTGASGGTGGDADDNTGSGGGGGGAPGCGTSARGASGLGGYGGSGRLIITWET